MAARWVGLSRPKKKLVRNAVGAAKHHVHTLHALSVGGVLLMAAAMNFAMYPDALAQVVSGERAIVGFVPEEHAAGAAIPGVDTSVVPVDENEVRLLAATAWGEARSEGEGGMRAVAHVMQNRIGPRFGETLSTVILAPKQFSVWNRGDPNRRLVLSAFRNPEQFSAGDVEWEAAQRIAREVLAGQSVDPTGGALFYHTRAIRPRWSRIGVGRHEIGAHVFYADVPDAGIRDTPRVIDVMHLLTGGAERETATAGRRGPRAGRVRGVIQHAPVEAAGQSLPSENVNAAATPTLNGVPVVAPLPSTVGATS